jgi:hypothetical protein
MKPEARPEAPASTRVPTPLEVARARGRPIAERLDALAEELAEQVARAALLDDVRGSSLRYAGHALCGQTFNVGANLFTIGAPMRKEICRRAAGILAQRGWNASADGVSVKAVAWVERSAVEGQS